MVGNIILYFSTLASAFRLKAPLPPYLPPAEKARQQLVRIQRSLFFFECSAVNIYSFRSKPSES